MNIQEIFKQLHGRTPSLMGHEHFKESSVIIPLIEIDGETHILFEVRSMQMRSQPGDICFPGGRVDSTDKDPSHCAIRETMEELGLSKQDITDPIPLDYIVNDLGRIIYPFVGRIIQPDKIKPNPDEVDHTFTVPLSFFLETEPKRYNVHLHVKPEDNFPYHLIVGGENYDWRMRHVEELFYQYNDQTIWGLTAKILTHFIELIKTNERS
ncbi:CoA pyrophosphatase [Oceanobacillus kimchii]|uniref:NUDIX hydrolase n=1 Tax=Oceanobacillus kimchii TaxID=746691 RepID=UPI00034ABCA9|nr:CoA pyrophosphatase [Oceanobacillus kimchii]MCT1576762.1 CoA pyrophosphatase [Oceanobacillus kimchii]MCT2134832.1 CoA pyrophosphatase [Oceanobacillus kimchii]